MKTLFENNQNECDECGAKEICENPELGSYIGHGRKKILIIDEFVSKKEDVNGEIWADSENVDYFNNLMISFGINVYQDCWITKAIKCNTSGKINENHVKYCRKKLLQEIEDLKPDKIITLGYYSLKCLIGHKIKGRVSLTSDNLESWTNYIIPDQDLGCFIIPLNNLYHLDRNDTKYKRNSSQVLFEKQLKKGLDYNLSFYRHNYLSECSYFSTSEEAITFMKRVLNNSNKISIDFETSGLKPHEKGHKIYCIGISDGLLSYGFPIFKDPDFLQVLKDLLINRKIKKISHNMKFEMNWAEEILGYRIARLKYDTMIYSHILDNRKKTKGLKFQIYVNLGIIGYDNEADSYLKPSGNKGGNNFNILYKANIKEICEYCAMDAHLTYHLENLLKSRLNKDDHLLKGNELFHSGVKALQIVESNGIKVDKEKVIENDIQLEKALLKLEKEINGMDESKKWTGKEVFNFLSNQQLSHLLYTVLDLKCRKQTPSGGKSVDEEALTLLNHPYTNKILEYRKLYKIKNTYLEGFKKEIVKGYIHPIFNLHIPTTYRSSSSQPNFQNMPKRDILAKNYIRSCIIPENDMIGECDYSGIEVSIGACYHLDPEMIRYILEPDTDMHRDTASQLFFKKPEEINKQERQAAKNGFVFPQFYGDYWKQCAPNIWGQIDRDTINYLKENGIKNISNFMDHVRYVENDFWKNRFMVYGKWRERHWRKYLRDGYVELKTGFRMYHNMTKNKCNNAPIQGSAFHCLLWSLIQISNYLQKNKLKTKIIGQIHDSIVMDINRNEWESGLKEVVKEIMTIKIREFWDWIIVPLEVEAEYYYSNWSSVDDKEIL